MASLLPITSSSATASSSNHPSGSSSSSSLPPLRFNSSSNFGGAGGGGGGGGPSSFASLASRVRKMSKFGRMDFELAFSNLCWLCVSPRRVYRNVYYHKQTKNQWARDDPAMLVLIAACLAVTSIAWSILYSYTLFQTISTTFLMIFRDFLLSSAVIATIFWFITNNLLLSPPTHSSSADAKVEWQFAFDVAVNAFFCFFLWVYVLEFVLSGLITRDNWVCLWLGNSLWLAALSQYVYITYLGFAALPFIIRSELLLTPLLPVFVGYVLSLLGFNMSKTVLEAYFS
ncbi:UNC-50 family-domain-containing protein [Mrakia frigida]|uniref:Gmh1p n=1 Tax=Mrakia frigida TaxID=29902 RepID=UPI003FCBF2E1